MSEGDRAPSAPPPPPLPMPTFTLSSVPTPMSMYQMSSVPSPPIMPAYANHTIDNGNPVQSQSKNAESELLDAQLRIWQEEGIEGPPVIIVYRHIDPILQEGPTCGLVALSMASSCTRRPVSVQQLLHQAKYLGFTNQGEIFSVDYMATLASEVLGTFTSIEVLQSGLTLNRERIINLISRGSILLIPYDADRNHMPCIRRGHKAHWAAVVGVLCSTRTCHLIALQGKSRHLGVWRYEDLQRSNENLIELDPSREDDGKTYVLPCGGLREGLNGRAVFLHYLDSNEAKNSSTYFTNPSAF